MSSVRPQFKVPIARPKVPGPETIPHYWHPYRAGVKMAPDWFRAQLDAFDEGLAATWNPIIERWMLWIRRPNAKHPICWGWQLLFIHRGPSGEYLPLDERVFARLYHASSRAWGDGRKYFDRIAAEYQRDHEMSERKRRQDLIDEAMPIWEHSQIKNIGKGNKFSTYHA